MGNWSGYAKIYTKTGKRRPSKSPSPISRCWRCGWRWSGRYLRRKKRRLRRSGFFALSLRLMFPPRTAPPMAAQRSRRTSRRHFKQGKTPNPPRTENIKPKPLSIRYNRCARPYSTTRSAGGRPTEARAEGGEAVSNFDLALAAPNIPVFLQGKRRTLGAGYTIPKKMANALVIASISVSSSLPNTSPHFSRGTVIALSTIT